MVCNCNCLIETEGFFKVTGSHVHCESGNISETVQDRDVTNLLLQITDGKSYIAYQIVEIPMMMSDLQGHVPNAGLLNTNFHTAVQQLTRFQLIVHHAVPL